jgi:hypothetical protein
MPQKDVMDYYPNSPDIADVLADLGPADALLAIHESFAGTVSSGELPFRERIIKSVTAAAAAGKASPSEWIQAIFTAAPDFLRGPNARASEDLLSRLVIQILSPEPPEKRAPILTSIIAGTEDLSLACALFCLVGGEGAAERSGAEVGAPFFGAAAPDLVAALLARIARLADSGNFWAQAAPRSILWFWFNFGEEHRVYAFTQKALGETRAALALFEAAIDQEVSPDGTFAIVAVRRWSRIVDLIALERRGLELSLSASSRSERAKARRFLDALAAGQSELFR